MSMTLRQLQRLLAKSETDPRTKVRFDTVADEDSFREFTAEVFGTSFQRPCLFNGGVREVCTCSDCDSNRLHKIRSYVDSFAKKYGHSATLKDVCEAVQRRRQQHRQENSDEGNQQSSSSQQQSTPQRGQPSAAKTGGGRGDTNQSPPPASAENSAEPPSPEEWVPTPPEPVKQPQKTREEIASDKEQELRRDLKRIQEALKAAKEKKPSSLEQYAQLEMAQRLRKTLKRFRKDRSRLAAAAGTMSGPSLAARRRAAGSHGRLRRVSPKLRSQTAELINRLVDKSGTAGDQLTAIPLLSPRKLVKRMVVRRSLSNAFREDSNAGRPVTLFLPDVSPSCARQAQIACDIANAAGYAGVAGSDVLVFPHSNGCVESDYVPWFNGRPHLVDKTKVQTLFNAIVAGESRYNIRVVIALGDHDAVEMYRQVAEQSRINRLVWLHNLRISPEGPGIWPASSSRLSLWPSSALDKTTLVHGCVDEATILTGLEIALQ